MAQQVRDKLEILNSKFSHWVICVNKMLDNTSLSDDKLQVIENYLDHYISIYDSVFLLLEKSDVSKEDFKQINDGLKQGIQMLDEI